MKRILILLTVFTISLACKTTETTVVKAKTTAPLFSKRPKLIVGLVVDQMRYDYMTRFYSKFGDGGFKRLVNDGFNCKNTHFNYVPTYTAPGHTSIYTGTTPATHGIIGNNWFDKETGAYIYCTDDASVQTVGTTTAAGQMSPKNEMTTTMTDQLRLDTNFQGKVIGISIKDRASILPAGHLANAAYWFDGGNEGRFISSTFYINKLPQWVKSFNDSRQVDNYMKTWDTYYEINTYTESIADKNIFEKPFEGLEQATFPYDLKKLAKANEGYSLLKSTPFGNTMTKDFAKLAIANEQLGQDNITDFLAVSFSATDYIGHRFGVDSKEVEDTYIRLDKDIEDLLNYLDEKVGKGNYSLFLTSDHGGVRVPAYLEEIKVPAGYVNNKKLKKKIRKILSKKYGVDDLIANISNYQVFLDKKALKKANLSKKKVANYLKSKLEELPHVYQCVTGANLHSTSFTSGIMQKIQMGHHPKRSGDVVIILEPAYISGYGRQGSTHGSGFGYDTHVPLLFFGKGISKGLTYELVEIHDVAPTVSALLDMEAPSGCTGKPILEVLK
jgi:predicted AlkP superfamily pyrophosphatase or phosphodiesterase